MIHAYLQTGLPEYADVPVLVYGAKVMTYRELAGRAAEMLPLLVKTRSHRAGILLRDPSHFLVALVASDFPGSHVLLAGDLENRAAQSLAIQYRLELLVREGQAYPSEISPGELGPESHPDAKVTLLTSGTTGYPKAIRHTWATLAAPARIKSCYARTRWLCPYPLYLYAGLQVVLQAILNWATLVVPDSLEPSALVRCLAEQNVGYASGTPTFWRRVLFLGSVRPSIAPNLRQITLGGEPTPQDLLDRLKVIFPTARIVHVFATTETGRLFAVSDGREGFPVEYLDRAPEAGVQLQIRDGQLYARSKNAMISQEDVAMENDWLATGDLVEIQGQRVLFRGRVGDLINVGGRKVSAAKVESVLRRVPGIADLRVHGRSSSVTGELVAVDIVAEPGIDAPELERRVHDFGLNSLQPEERPRIVSFVRELAAGPAMKIPRKRTD